MEVGESPLVGKEMGGSKAVIRDFCPFKLQRKAGHRSMSGRMSAHDAPSFATTTECMLLDKS